MISNQQIKNLRRLHQKKHRRESGQFLIEGLRLCEEAVDAGATLREVVVCEEKKISDRMSRLIAALNERAIPVRNATRTQFKALTATETPQAILAVVDKASIPSWQEALKPGPALLVLDAISDPGNLGTILRSAAWFGVESILLCGDCAEIHNPKTVRSTMGALFHLRLFEDLDVLQVVTRAKEERFRIIATYPHDGRLASVVFPTGRDLLLIGSEAHGLPESLTPLIDLGITIAASGHGESLNAAVAASIILYEFSRRK
jgi:RNA methyltransferase, TrmH family